MIQAILPTTLLAGVVLIVLATIGLGMRNPVLLRLGLRNTMRRPTQSLIIIAGLVLSTGLITTFVALPDSLNASTVADRLVRAGHVDESVTGPLTQDQITQALASLGRLSQVQAATAASLQRATVTSERTQVSFGNQSSDDLYLLAVPPAFDQVYGPITDNQGHTLRFAGLRPGDVLVSSTLAQRFDVRPGDQIQIKQQGLEGTFPGTVRAVLSHDLVLTSAELAADAALPEVIVPTITIQQMFAQRYHLPFVPNLLCVKNVGSGGLDDGGPDGSRSQTVLQLLQSIFRVAPVDTSDPEITRAPTDLTSLSIHPLKPGAVTFQGPAGFAGNISMIPVLSNKLELSQSPAARQLFLLLPAFSCLLVGAGILLQILLSLLLAVERRIELAMCRAIGLQRHHLMYILLIEGCSYGVMAGVFGVGLGIAALALELAVLGQAPTLFDPNIPIHTGHIPLFLSVSWQSIVTAWSIGVLLTVAVVGICSLWMSRTNIVAALRDLDDYPIVRVPLQILVRALRWQSFDAAGQLLPETLAKRYARLLETLGRFAWELCARGMLLLILGFLCFEVSILQNPSTTWLQLSSMALFIAGGGLFANWALSQLNLAASLVRRISFSLIGLGWLILGFQAGMALYVQAFAPTEGVLAPGTYVDQQPVLQTFLLTFLPLVGGVILIMSNVDLLVGMLSLLVRSIHSLSPLSHLSLVYPLTFRFRSGVTVLLLALIVFLVQLLVVNNLSSIQQTQLPLTTGNFQLELSTTDPRASQVLGTQLLATPTTLRQDIAVATQMRFLYSPAGPTTPIVLLPGRLAYGSGYPPMVVDATYLSQTTMPMYVRAQGYASDQQVWAAVRDHPGDVVMQYKDGLGLPTSNGFPPFAVDIPTSAAPGATYHRVTVVGIVAGNTYWSTIFLSQRTAAEIVSQPSSWTYYYFRFQPGVSANQVISDLHRVLPLAAYNVTLSSLEETDQNAYTASLTSFLSSYLVMGLLFGAFSIGVITSHSVVERRQQIGMLRALGFSRELIRRSFLLEASFLIILGLVIGTGLAWWLSIQIAHAASLDVSIPSVPVALLLIGSYLVALGCIILPAQRASHIPPAEALRYE
jgi:ABC-type antimicrobial peptide transport system permease subunit